MRRVLRAAAALACLTCATGSALAHGTQYRVLGQGETLVEFAYTDGELMAFAAFDLFAPGESQVPVRSGRTDRQGRVGFVPEQPGEWRIEVRDSEGHTVRAVLTATGGQVSSATGLPAWLGAISLSLNAVGAALLAQALLQRRRQRRQARARPA